MIRKQGGQGLRAAMSFGGKNLISLDGMMRIEVEKELDKRISKSLSPIKISNF